MSKSRPPDPTKKDGTPGGRAIGDDERALWHHVTGDVRPLPKVPKPPAGAAVSPPGSTDTPGPGIAPGGGPGPKRPQKRPRAGAPAPIPAPPPEPPPEPPKEPGLSHGAAPGLDKRTQMRLKRGQVELDAVIDLHGHTQTEAHRALAAFLQGSREAGRRTVLVITGKGQAGGGVLRDAVPRWLNEPGFRPMIRAFAHAQPKHGGEGALYVLLKRKR